MGTQYHWHGDVSGDISDPANFKTAGGGACPAGHPSNAAGDSAVLDGTDFPSAPPSNMPSTGISDVPWHFRSLAVLPPLGGTNVVAGNGSSNPIFTNVADSDGDNAIFGVATFFQLTMNLAAGANMDGAGLALVVTDWMSLDGGTTKIVSRLADYDTIHSALTDAGVPSATADAITCATALADEAARNVDPGVANVKNGTGYEIRGATNSGVMPAGSGRRRPL